MKQQQKICAYCGGDFIPERRNGMYCSPTCRQYSYIKRKTGKAPYDRVKEKETVKQELQFVPALVIENDSEENVEEQNQELSIATIENNQSNLTEGENEINLASKEKFAMKNNPSNYQMSNSVELVNKAAIDSSLTKSYDDLLEQEKDSLNEMLTNWWFCNIGDNKEKLKLVIEKKKQKYLLSNF